MRLLITICLCGLASLAAAQSTIQQRLDSLVEQEITAADFSGVVFVAREGEVLLHRAAGMAYYQAEVPIKPNTRFSIASVTKLFTAIAILQLQAEGKLSIEDKLGQYLAELSVPMDDKITLADLLLHQAGLPNEKAASYRHRLAPRTFVEKTLSNRAKGDYGTYNYNNLDYVLLGLVVEQVTEQPWKEVVEKRILQPLGMENTGFLEYGYYPKNFAYTYSTGRKLQQDPLFYIENFYAAGSMYSTAQDLWLLDQGLSGSELLPEPARELLSQEFPENNYAGYSVWNYRYPFVAEQPQVMERRGGILGANVVMVRLPGDDSCIIILSNTDGFNPDSFGDPHNLREALLRALYTPVTR